MAFLGGVRIAAWTDSEIFSAFRCRASDHKEVFVGGLTRFHCGGVKPAPVYHHHHHATINSFSGEVQGLKRAWCGNSRIQQQGVAMKALKSFKETDQVPIPLLRGLLSAMVKPYLIKNPTAMTALDLIRTHVGGPLCYDHFAFRTFGVRIILFLGFMIHMVFCMENSRQIQDIHICTVGLNTALKHQQVNGCGIDSMSQVFLDLGYKVRDELRFPAKKVRALWFSPPKHLLDMEGSEADGPLPRIFISELIVNELSLAAQEIIHKYTSSSTPLAKHAAAASILNSLTWPTPQLTDYQTLAK
jgi:hypothetical protein